WFYRSGRVELGRIDAGARHSLRSEPFGRHYTPAHLLFLSATFLDLGPRVAQRDRTVEHQRSALGINGVDGEITEPLELVAAAGRGRGQTRLELGAGQNLQRVRIEIGTIVLPLGDVVGIGLGKQVIVETNFGFNRVVGRYPVNRCLHFSAVRSVSAARCGV